MNLYDTYPWGVAPGSIRTPGSDCSDLWSWSGSITAVWGIQLFWIHISPKIDEPILGPGALDLDLGYKSMVSVLLSVLDAFLCSKISFWVILNNPKSLGCFYRPQTIVFALKRKSDLERTKSVTRISRWNLEIRLLAHSLRISWTHALTLFIPWLLE